MRRSEDNDQPHASVTSASPRPKAPPINAALTRASATSSPAVQRLTAASLDAARISNGGHIPDATPTLAQGGRLGAALSRFSGSGVVPRPLVQRQESRAKAMTLTLASIATILILLSAFLIFDPNLRNLGWGFALGNRLIPNYTNQKVTIPGKAPSTPTPVPTATGIPTTPTSPMPTATTASAGGGGDLPRRLYHQNRPRRRCHRLRRRCLRPRRQIPTRTRRLSRLRRPARRSIQRTLSVWVVLRSTDRAILQAITILLMGSRLLRMPLAR